MTHAASGARVPITAARSTRSRLAAAAKTTSWLSTELTDMLAPRSTIVMEGLSRPAGRLRHRDDEDVMKGFPHPLLPEALHSPDVRSADNIDALPSNGR